jgi:hypothetical protein
MADKHEKATRPADVITVSAPQLEHSFCFAAYRIIPPRLTNEELRRLTSGDDSHDDWHRLNAE